MVGGGAAGGRAAGGGVVGGGAAGGGVVGGRERVVGGSEGGAKGAKRTLERVGEVPGECKRKKETPTPGAGDQWATRWGQKDVDHGAFGNVFVTGVDVSKKTAAVMYISGEVTGTVVKDMPFSFMFKKLVIPATVTRS